jgi:hypothetical protein
VYPEIFNGQTAIGVAERLVEGLLPRMRAETTELPIATRRAS